MAMDRHPKHEEDMYDRAQREAGPSLSELLANAKQREMTPEEAFEQRVSFIYGQLQDCAPNVTKEQVRERLRRHLMTYDIDRSPLVPAAEKIARLQQEVNRLSEGWKAAENRETDLRNRHSRYVNKMIEEKLRLWATLQTVRKYLMTIPDAEALKHLDQIDKVCRQVK